MHGSQFSISMHICMDIILEASKWSDGEVVDRRGGRCLRFEGLHKEAFIGEFVAESSDKCFASLDGEGVEHVTPLLSSILRHDTDDGIITFDFIGIIWVSFRLDRSIDIDGGDVDVLTLQESFQFGGEGRGQAHLGVSNQLAKFLGVRNNVVGSKKIIVGDFFR